VNHLGYYNGGVPKKGNGTARGNGWASAGFWHDNIKHNDYVNPHQDTATITSKEKFEF